MFLKGNLHGDGAKLTRYMLTGEKGEIAQFIEARGFDFFHSDPVEAARLMQRMAELLTNSDMPFFHGQARTDPHERLTDADWVEVIDRMEKRLGFTGQPRFVTAHIDPQSGEKHFHAAWFRLDPERECVIDPGLFKNRLREEARKVEKNFALRELSDHRQPHDRARYADRREVEESRRLGTNVREIRTAILDAFEKSDSGRAFAAAIQTHGYELAYGDRHDCFVVVDHAGGQHALNKKLTGKTLQETRQRFSDIGRMQLPSVEEAQEMQAARKPAREALRTHRSMAGGIGPGQANAPSDGRGRTRQAAFAEKGRGATRGRYSGLSAEATAKARPLGHTAGEMRLAWRLTTTAGEFAQEIEKRGLILVYVTPDQAQESYRKHAFAKAVGRQNRALKEGFAVVDRRGNVTRIDQRTTGDLRAEIDKRLGGIDRDKLMNVADARQLMREANKAAWLERQRDERDGQRPATGIEQTIIECREKARDSGATVQTWRHNGEVASRADALADRLKPENKRQTERATIHGGPAFVARLEHAGIAIVRVTAEDVKALDALRSEEQEARAATKDVQARRAGSFAKVKEGGIAAVTRAGNVFRLNPHRIDLAGLESAISSTVPSVTEARARFESERGKIGEIWEQRRTDSQTRRAQRDQSAARGRTIRGAESATLKTGATVNRTTNLAGKGAGIAGRGILGVLAGLVKWLDPFPAKPPSPQQQERNYWAAKEQEATDQINRRKKITGDELRAQMARDDQERARRSRERGRDDDYGRER
jgi:hypothetical protein